MAIQLPNFQRISFQEANPFLSGLISGQQIGQNFLNFPLSYKNQQLNNQILASKAKYASPMEAARLAYQQAATPNLEAQTALTNKEVDWSDPKMRSLLALQAAQSSNLNSETQRKQWELQHPGYMGGNESKTIQALMDMGIINNDNLQNGGNKKNNGLNSDQSNSSYAPFNTGNSMVDAILNQPFSKIAYQNKMTQAFNWAHSPLDVKNYQVAQLAGAGIDPSEAVQQLTSGKTVSEILNDKGFDPSNPPSPDFLPTKGNIQQLNSRKSAMAAVNQLGSYVREGLGPYSQTIMNYSPSQIADSLSGMNRDQQVKFLAARGIVPELTTMRLSAAGGKVTVHAIEAMQDASLNNIKVLRPLISGDVWKDVQSEIDKQINNAMSASNSSYTLKKSKSNVDPLGIR